MGNRIKSIILSNIIILIILVIPISNLTNCYANEISEDLFQNESIEVISNSNLPIFNGVLF